VKERLSQKDLSGGFILDGFPRTVAQAEALYQWKESPRIDRVVNFDIPEEDLINRLSGRWVCRKCGATYHKTFLPTKVEGVCDNCGSHDLFQRPDDMRESVEKRLQVYSEQTYPLIDFYTQKGILSHLDAQGTPEEVFKSMEKLLSLA
jgi:adenylate kinase